MVRHIWADGACSQNGTWAGGYAIVELVENSLTAAYSDYEENTTNNIMELKALYKALILANSHPAEKTIIHIDSAYAMNCIFSWAKNWSRNGWLTSKKEPVQNKELIETIYNYYTKNFSFSQNLSVQKVKGHAGIIGNELADSLARKNEKDFRKLISVNNVLVNYSECKNNFAILSSQG